MQIKHYLRNKEQKIMAHYFEIKGETELVNVSFFGAEFNLKSSDDAIKVFATTLTEGFAEATSLKVGTEMCFMGRIEQDMLIAYKITLP